MTENGILPETELLPDLQDVYLPHLGILVGSLRTDSSNLRLAEEALLCVREMADGEIIIPDVPLFSEDYERPNEEPSSPAARSLRDAFRRAEALLVCSPEYDRLPSAITLNACHWASRGPDRPLAGKPVLLAGVSSGEKGTRAARPALRLAFQRIGTEVLDEDIFIGSQESPEQIQAELRQKLPLLLGALS